MAGRILPVALAGIAGVSIAVSTLDGEFKAQRMQRLQKEYDQEVAAASALNTEGASPIATSAMTYPAPKQVQAKEEELKAITAPAPSPAPSASSWSSLLGLWAWKDTDGRKEGTGAGRGKP